MSVKAIPFVIIGLIISLIMLNAYQPPRVSLVAEEFTEEKRLDKGVEPFRLNGWLEEHFIYSLNNAGHCENVTKCIEELDKKGYTTGVCYDYSRVFSYLYIKAGYGDPLIVTTDLGNGTLHDQVLFILDDGYIAEAYGMGGRVVRFDFASNILKINANRQKKDIYLYELVKALGYVTGYPESIAKSKGGFIIRKTGSQLHITGMGEIKCDCPMNVLQGCPLTGYDVIVTPDRVVCHLRIGDKEVPLIMSFEDYVG